MKVDVPGRGTVDVSHVVVLGPVWTDPDMYRETCHLLQRTADAAAGAAQQTYVDVRPALDAALASWDPMEDVRRLMLRSAVE